MTNNERRRTLIINREFQLRFVGGLALAMVSHLLLFFCLAVLMPAVVGYFASVPDWGVMESFLRARSLWLTVLLPLVCTFLFLFSKGIAESHRIAGPAYRFRVIADGLARLRVPNAVRIRRNDHMQDVATGFSDGLGRIADEVRALRIEADAAAELAASSGSDSAELSDRIQAIQSRLAQFTLTDPWGNALPEESSDVEPAVDELDEVVEPLEEEPATSDRNA